MTLLKINESKQCIKFYCIKEEFCRPTKTVKSLAMSKFFKNSKTISYVCTIIIYNSYDENVSPFYLKMYTVRDALDMYVKILVLTLIIGMFVFYI